jgi:hypothetical protein
MNMTIVTTLIAIIEQFLPLLGTSSATVTMIDGIISGLTKLMPLITEFVPVVYSSIKNITISLRNAMQNDPAATKAQWDAIDAIDATLDAANDAAMAAVDPDAPSIS